MNFGELVCEIYSATLKNERKKDNQTNDKCNFIILSLVNRLPLENHKQKKN